MNFLIITKKQILILFLVLTFVFCFIIYCTCFAKEVTCSGNYIFSIASQNDFTVITDLQNKLDNIYSSDEKVAFLTFDDGPTKIATPKVLNILKENDVHASFFVIGYRVNEFPNIVKRAYEEGNFIANHGYSHKNSKLYENKESFINEVLTTDEAISNAIGVSNYHSHVFRFPNGSTGSNYSGAKKNCKNYLKEIGYCFVDWNALNNDSIKKYSPEQILNNLKKTCKNKDSIIILMHDTIDVSRSYESLDASIKYLKEQGYTFKTFEEFFK